MVICKNIEYLKVKSTWDRLVEIQVEKKNFDHIAGRGQELKWHIKEVI